MLKMTHSTGRGNYSDYSLHEMKLNSNDEAFGLIFTDSN